MLHGDYNEILRGTNRLSDCTEEVIQLIKRMIDTVFNLLGDNVQIQASLDVYINALHALEDILRTNDVLRKAAEEYICCISASSSVNEIGYHPQSAELGENKIKENDSAVARRAAERRKALAEALRTGQPIMVNPDGTIAISHEVSSDSNVQINVSSPDAACGDSPFAGIVVPSGKLAGGIPSNCRVCGNPVFSGANYCPYCGTSVSVDKLAVKLHKVQFSAIAPKVLIKGEYTIISVVMYEESCRHIVDELISAINEPTQETRSGVQKVNEGAVIKIVLNSPDLAIEDNTETGIWQGDYLDFSFALQLPPDFKKRQILFAASVYINDVIASKLKLIVKCSSLFEQKIQISRTDVFSAFISYASQDRNRVAAIIQGMKKARPDLAVFFDVDSLRSGDDWELALREEIERRDVLFLCWSHFARESKWVNEEWRYAFEKKGIDGIEPVPIESPDVCPPPEELRKKHFNDKLLYIINA